MYIKDLQLTNYRNYGDFRIDTDEGLNFIVGKNAAGKTNLLEAIYFLENGRSHRTSSITDLVRWEEEFAGVKAQVVRADREISVEATVFKAGGKQVKVNGVLDRKLASKGRPILTVIFTPDHLKIVKEMPEHRRDYLDEILEKVKPDYGYWRGQYSKVLRQRNILLKKVFVGRMKADVIDYWDRQLVAAGVKVTIARRALVDELQAHADEAFKAISDSDVAFSLRYENQLIKEGEGGSLDEVYLRALEAKRKQEVERGQTLVGPHRDDVALLADGIDLRAFGSQGEQRTAALALKKAELTVISQKANDLPILLLDDVLSELDETRRTALLGMVSDGAQAIITSANVDYLNGADASRMRIIAVP